jgi:uncharacterized protein
MDAELLVLFFLLALVAEVIGTVSGFGSSILFVPLATFFFDFHTVLGITAVFHVFSNLSKIALFRHGIRKDIALRLGIPAVAFVIVGALLTGLFPTRYIELGMNILLVLMAVWLLVFSEKTISQTNRNLFIGGTVSGFLAGLIGTGGAIRGITLSAFALEKNVFIATSALIDMGVDSSRAVVYVAQGYFTREHVMLIPFLIAISLLGTWLGKLILQRTSQRVFRYLVLGVVMLTAAIQLVRMISGEA